ncbi:unnamed protein product [Agarophyton chilense]
MPLPSTTRPSTQTLTKLCQAWQRLVQKGIPCHNRRLSLSRVLAIWALTLLCIHIINLLLRATTPRQGAPPYRTKSSFQADTHFWHHRHLIFCVSPGRSGSKYLRNVLNVAENIISRHEPEPKMTDTHLQRVILQGMRRETFHQRAQLKLAAIRQALEATTPNVAYAETTHMFVKTFADVVLEHLADSANISIVILHRPARDSIWSQLRLGWFSPAHSGKNVWYYDINDVHQTEKQLSYSTNSSNPIDSLIGYNADVLQRAIELNAQIKRRQRQGAWKNVRVIETWLKAVSETDDGVKNFLSTLGLKTDLRRLAQLKTLDINARDVKKDKFVTTATIHDVDARIQYMLNKLPLPRQALQPPPV